MGTTNILDLNNRLTKVEKENVAQNSYTSLKNKPKINNVTLTGNKSLADIGAAKKYTYYTSSTGVNAIDLTQISFDELEIVVIAPLTSYSCVFDLHVFKTDLRSTYLYYSTGNSTGNKSSMIKVGITQSLCILNTSICENVDVINDTVIKVYYC